MATWGAAHHGGGGGERRDDYPHQHRRRSRSRSRERRDYANNNSSYGGRRESPAGDDNRWRRHDDDSGRGRSDDPERDERRRDRLRDDGRWRGSDDEDSYHQQQQQQRRRRAPSYDDPQRRRENGDGDGQWNDRRGDDGPYDDGGGRGGGHYGHGSGGGGEGGHNGHGGSGGGGREERRKRTADWVCSQCKLTNFAKRQECFKCGKTRTEEDALVVPPGAEYPGGSRDPIGDHMSRSPTAVLLLKHLKIGATEQAVTEALRAYVQVKTVNLLEAPPRPGGPSNPVAFVEFHSVDYARHVMAATAKVPGAALVNDSGEVTSSSIEVAGASARLYFAKPSAMRLKALVPPGLPPGYLPGMGMPPKAQRRFLDHSMAQQAAVGAAPAAFETSQSVLEDVNQRMGKYGVALAGIGGGAPHPHPRQQQHAEELSSAVQERILRKQEQQAAGGSGHGSGWPPSFDEDGTAWVFDPASGYFLHTATGMYYEPKSRWYCRRARDSGQYVYYHYHKGQNPPYVVASAAATAAPSAASSDAAASGAAAGAFAADPSGGASAGAATAAVVPIAATAAATAATTAAAASGPKKPVSFGLSLGGGSKGKNKGPSLAVKKHMKDMNMWGARAQADAASEASEAAAQAAAEAKAAEEASKPLSLALKSSSSAAAAAAAAAAQRVSATKAQADAAAAAASTVALLAASPAATLLGLGVAGGAGTAASTSAAASSLDPRVLGLDYRSLRKLRLDSGALVERQATDGGSKWACLVSRRAFATEEQLAKHVRLSKLYKEELFKAIAAGRISIAPGV